MRKHLSTTKLVEDTPCPTTQELEPGRKQVRFWASRTEYYNGARVGGGDHLYPEFSARLHRFPRPESPLYVPHSARHVLAGSPVSVIERICEWEGRSNCGIVGWYAL